MDINLQISFKKMFQVLQHLFCSCSGFSYGGYSKHEIHHSLCILDEVNMCLDTYRDLNEEHQAYRQRSRRVRLQRRPAAHRSTWPRRPWEHELVLEFALGCSELIRMCRGFSPAVVRLIQNLYLYGRGQQEGTVVQVKSCFVRYSQLFIQFLQDDP